MPSSTGKKPSSLLLITIGILVPAVIVIVFILNGAITPPKAKDKWKKMDSFNFGSTGTLALKEFLEKEGFEVKRLVSAPGVNMDSDNDYAIKKPYTKEVSTNNIKQMDTLLIFQPEYLVGESVTEITNYSKAGNRIIIFTDYPSSIQELFALKNDTKGTLSAKAMQVKYWGLPETNISKGLKCTDSGLLEGVTNLDLKYSYRIKKYNKSWTPYLRDDVGVIAIRRKIGDGEIILFFNSLFASNYLLRKADNGLFFYNMMNNLVGENTIYMGDYYHGYEERFTIFYFLTKPEYVLILVHLILFTLFAVYANQLRFGQYRPIEKLEDTRIFFYSEGMGDILARNEYSPELCKLLEHDYKQWKALFPHRAQGKDAKAIEEYLSSPEYKTHSSKALKELYTLTRKIIK